MRASSARLLTVLGVVGLIGMSCGSAGASGQAGNPTVAPATAPLAAVTPSPLPPTPDPTPAPTSAPASPAGTTAPVVRGPFTIVSGIEEFLIEDTGTWTTKNGIDRGRGLTLKCTDVANDPRVSGTTTETWNFDFLGTPPAAGLDWGVRRLENDGGAWEGIVLGAAYPGSREQLTMVLAGSGGYAGMTYYMHVDGSAAAQTFPFEGIIYEGTIPIPSFPEP
jgi:hypothetical protein